MAFAMRELGQVWPGEELDWPGAGLDWPGAELYWPGAGLDWQGVRARVEWELG